jgi:hypothetical protein
MIERFKAFIQSQGTAEIPRYWEQEVSNSYRILKFQMQLAQEARAMENFQAGEHAGRIKTRIRNLKDMVFDISAREISIQNPPSFLWAQAEEPKKVYFYLPYADKLISANHEAIPNGLGGLDFRPVLTTAVDIDESIWCLDQALVKSLSTNLISLLPKKSFLRILSQTA